MYVSIISLYSILCKTMTSTESKDIPLPDVKMVEKTDGDVHFSLVSIDGMNMIPFMVLMDVGPAQRFVDVRNLEVREDDIILATFLKSGMSACKTATMRNSL